MGLPLRHGTKSRLTAVAILTISSGCASLQPAPPTLFTQTITAAVPVLSPMPQTPAVQPRGGVTLTLAAATGQIRRTLQCKYTPHQALVLIMPAGASKSTHQLYREARFEAPEATSSSVQLQLTVRNDMQRVFRGAGSALQFSIDGQAKPAAQEAYLDFLNTQILPREQRVVRLSPVAETLQSLQRAGAFGVFLYDVPTKTDAAGNVQARENFEWYFKVSRRDTTETVSVLPRTVWIPNEDARIINSAPGQITRCFDGVYPKDNY